MKKISMIYIALALVAVMATDGSGQSGFSSQDILSTLKKGHPRLMAGIEDFSRLKSDLATSDFLKQSESTIHKKADMLFVKSVKARPYASGKSILFTSRDILDRSYTLSMMYRLSMDKKYADRLWEELQNAGRFPDWGTQHFLDVAEMTYAFSIAYDWLYDVWTKDQRKFIAESIKNKGLLKGMLYYNQQYRKGFNWTSVDHNWNQVCNGALAIGALAIADEAPVLAKDILKNALMRIPKAMRNYGPDGAWSEGPGYLQYALKYNVALIASLESALGKDFGLSQIPGFSSTGKFIVCLSSPTGITFNYADNAAKIVQMPELLWLAGKFDQPQLTKYQEKWTDHSTAIEMLWYHVAAQTADLPLNNYFRGGEVVTLRSSWTDPSALFVGFKAGKNGVNHGHLDLGSFVLDWKGKRWVSDPGADSYSLKGYFSGGRSANAQRWKYYRTNTEGHNTLLLDNGDNFNQDPGASCKVERFSGKTEHPFGIMDLTDAYPAAASIKRGIALNGNESLLVQDEVRMKTSSDIYWQIHTQANIVLGADPKKCMLTIGKDQVSAEILSPEGAAFQIMPAQPQLQFLDITKNNKNKTLKRLVIALKNTRSQIITVLFKSADDKSSFKPQTLSSWN